jgi:hypothetical protein
MGRQPRFHLGHFLWRQLRRAASAWGFAVAPGRALRQARLLPHTGLIEGALVPCRLWGRWIAPVSLLLLAEIPRMQL